MQRNLLKRVRVTSQASAKVIKKYAHKLGLKTTPDVIFGKHKKIRVVSKRKANPGSGLRLHDTGKHSGFTR